jgi:hypothetical protein
VASDPPNSGHQTPEQEIERLAQEIGRLIQSVEPQRREDLKELAFTLIREEVFQRGEEEKPGQRLAPAPFNPLGSGVLIFILGGGLFFVFPPVGVVLMFGGFLFILWGAVISMVKKKVK